MASRRLKNFQFENIYKNVHFDGQRFGGEVVVECALMGMGLPPKRVGASVHSDRQPFVAVIPQEGRQGLAD